MMPANSFRLVLYCMIMIPGLAFSQSQVKLLTYLADLGQKHRVNFNYLSEDLRVYKVSRSDNFEGLESKLQAISLQIPIDFEFLDAKNIVVKRLETYYCLQFFTKEPNFFPLSDVYLSNEDKIIGKTYTNGTLILSELPDSSSLKAYREGFEILEIEASALKPVVCQSYFFEQKIDLDEVTITGFLTRGLDLNSDMSLSLNSQEFEILPGLTQPDVLQAMQLLPGVVSLDERISNINVRGGTHDQNLFLWNGARLYQTSHFFGMISALNPSIAHGIDIYKNGSSAFFTEGLSSVVDISSTGNKPEKNRYEVFANLLESRARADLKLSSDSHLRIAGRYGLTGFWDTPTFQNYYDKIFQNTEITSFSDDQEIGLSSEAVLNYFDANLQYETKLNERTSWQINLLAISNKLEFSEKNLNSLDEQNNRLRQESYIATTQIDKKFSKNISASALAYASYYNLDAENAVLVSEQQLTQQNEIQDYGLKLRSDIEFDNNSVLSMGYQFNEIGIRNNNIVTNPDVTIRQKSVLQTHSAIAEWQSDFLSNKLSSKIGLRANYYDKFSEFRFEPHINLTYKWSPFLSTILLAEQKNQVTAQLIDLQNDFFGIENRRWFLADQSRIPVQRLRQIEIAQVYSKKSLLLTANLFYKTVQGISSSAQNFQNQLEFLQLSGNYQTYGAEFFIQKTFLDFRFWFNYAYNISDYEFNTFSPAVFPNNFETSHQYQLGLSCVSDPFKMSISGRYFTGRPTTLIDETKPLINPVTNPQINFLSPNADNISAYTQVNFTGSYTKKFKGLVAETGISILNLFSSGDITNQFYRLNNDELVVERVENRSLDFTPNVFLKLNF